MNKRICCRGIILKDNKVAIMRRIKENNEYYVYPGGGLEKEDISNETCVIREIKEEFGINIKVIKQLYEYHNDDSIQYFYLCEWIDGQLGTGQGPEMINPRPEKGQYFPALLEVTNIKNIDLKPNILTSQLISDLEKYGLGLNNEIKLIEE